MLPFIHTVVTRHVLCNRGFPPATRRIVEQTVQWNDWYYWCDMVAHAATPLSADQVTTADPAESADKCAGILRSHVKRITETTDESERLVWLGLALHLVQDIATHQGRTHGEHCLQALLLFPNPDYSPSGIILGKRYSHRLLTELEKRLGEDRFQQLKTSPGARLLNPSEQIQLLGPKIFSWPSAISSIIRAGFRQLLPNRPPRIRWDTESVVRQGLEMD